MVAGAMLRFKSPYAKADDEAYGLEQVVEDIVDGPSYYDHSGRGAVELAERRAEAATQLLIALMNELYDSGQLIEEQVANIVGDKHAVLTKGGFVVEARTK